MARRHIPIAPAEARANDRLPAILLTLLAVVAASQTRLVSRLHQLPSEYFGGDLYYQMGCIHSIRDSGNPMSSCSTSGALPGYLPLYGTLVAAFARVSSLGVFPSMPVMGVALKVLAAFAVYLLIAGGFGNNGIVFQEDLPGVAVQADGRYSSQEPWAAGSE